MILCKFCGEEVGAVEASETAAPRGGVHSLYPVDGLDTVLNARSLRQDQYVVLHHGCQSAQMRRGDSFWNPETDWWACQEPDRHADEDIHFDLGCELCAQRWISVRDELEAIMEQRKQP